MLLLSLQFGSVKFVPGLRISYRVGPDLYQSIMNEVSCEFYLSVQALA